MSKISEFAAKQAAFNEAMSTAVSGIEADVSALNAKIAEIQASSGAVSPEDQKLLDALEVVGQTLASRLTALDGLTPPAVPAG